MSTKRHRFILDLAPSEHDAATEVAEAQGIPVAEVFRRAARRYVVEHRERHAKPKKTTKGTPAGKVSP